jgi:hypothetical protein
MVAGSPVLPLPVEFVAGGEGNPDRTDPILELGLGGSGRSGNPKDVASVWDDEDGVDCNAWELASLPRYIADIGRFCFTLSVGRGGIDNVQVPRSSSYTFFSGLLALKRREMLNKNKGYKRSSVIW